MKSHILFTGGPAEYEEADRDANCSHCTWQDLLLGFDDFVVCLLSGYMGLEIVMDPEHVGADGDDCADEYAKEGNCRVDWVSHRVGRRGELGKKNLQLCSIPVKP